MSHVFLSATGFPVALSFEHLSTIRGNKILEEATNGHKPYAMIGAGPLSSALYKTGDELTGWRYSFNIHRTDFATGSVSNWLHPSDLLNVAKLIQVIGFEILADGCIDSHQRSTLQSLVNKLDEITKSENRTRRKLQ